MSYSFLRLTNPKDLVALIGSRYANIYVSLIFPSKSVTHNKEQKKIFGMITSSFLSVCVLKVAARFHQILDVNTLNLVHVIHLVLSRITHSINRF